MANQDYSTKMCSSCKMEHPQNDEYFFNNARSSDGLSNECKLCYYNRRKNRFKDEPCPVCGGQVPYRNGKYCSHECKGIARIGSERPDIKGKPAWNRGLTAETNESIRKASEAKLKNVVDEETLRQLYVEQDMTLREIGEIYGVSGQTIKRLVDEHGLVRAWRKQDDLTQGLVKELYESGMSFDDIAREYECSTAYVNQNFREGIEVRRYHPRKKSGERTSKGRLKIKIDKDSLHKLYVVDGLSYEAIAKRYGVSFSMIGVLVKQFGIERRTAWETRRGSEWVEPDTNIIVKLYQADKMSMDLIGGKFNVSREYIQRVLREHNIEIRESGYPNIGRYTAKDGHRVKSSLELQVDNWLYMNGILHVYEPKIKGTKYKADFLVGDTYIEIWGLIGNEKYEARMLKKCEAYEREGLKLISIYPDDFPKLKVLSEYFLKH